MRRRAVAKGRGESDRFFGIRFTGEQTNMLPYKLLRQAPKVNAFECYNKESCVGNTPARSMKSSLLRNNFDNSP